MYLVYPDSAHSALGQTIAKEAFISALNNREFELKVRDRDPIDLEAAFKAAIRVETHLKACEIDDRRNFKSNDYDDRRARGRKDDFGEPRVRNMGDKNPSAVVDETVRMRENGLSSMQSSVFYIHHSPVWDSISSMHYSTCPFTAV
jgi:hypothetical protein